MREIKCSTYADFVALDNDGEMKIQFDGNISLDTNNEGYAKKNLQLITYRAHVIQNRSMETGVSKFRLHRENNKFLDFC